MSGYHLQRLFFLHLQPNVHQTHFIEICLSVASAVDKHVNHILMYMLIAQMIYPKKVKLISVSNHKISNTQQEKKEKKYK